MYTIVYKMVDFHGKLTIKTGDPRYVFEHLDSSPCDMDWWYNNWLKTYSGEIKLRNNGKMYGELKDIWKNEDGKYFVAFYECGKSSFINFEWVQMCDGTKVESGKCYSFKAYFDVFPMVREYICRCARTDPKIKICSCVEKSPVWRTNFIVENLKLLSD